jgi:glyoxylase-like metal-dependent hydrolase (beta-lactamase superfamily II)
VTLPVELTKNITLLGTEFFSLYLVKGETYAIIEGGVSGVTYSFLNQLAQLGVPLESISYLVILHSHFDHMMVFPTLLEKYPWMKIVSSEQNRMTFSSGRILSKIFDSDRRVSLALMEKGLVTKIPNLNPPASFPLDIPVHEGSILDLGGGVNIRFIETPGHSPDCLSAYKEEEGVLFCSDGAGFYIPPNFFRPNYWSSLDDAEKSLDRIKAIDPEILCRGHYGAIKGKETIRNNLQNERRSMDAFKTFVLDRIQSGHSIDAITREVTDDFSKGFLEFFSDEENYKLWGLLIRRTLEHFGIEIEKTE